MLLKVALGLYGFGLALATPAAALDASLLSGQMEKLELVAPYPPAITSYLREDGSVGDISDYAGDVVVLNFWATWCAPCRAEMPSLQALQDTLGDEGVEVVTIAFGRHNPDAMKRFWQDTGVTSLPLHLDPQAEMAKALGVEGLPHTFILGPNGEVLAELTGEANWAAPETVALLRSLVPN